MNEEGQDKRPIAWFSWKSKENLIFHTFQFFNEIFLQNLDISHKTIWTLIWAALLSFQTGLNDSSEYGVCVCWRLMEKQTNEGLNIYTAWKSFFNLFCVATNLNKAEQDHKGQGRNEAKGRPFYLPLAIGEQ